LLTWKVVGRVVAGRCQAQYEASYKYGIINFDTLLHLVGFFYMNSLISPFGPVQKILSESVAVGTSALGHSTVIIAAAFWSRTPAVTYKTAHCFNLSEPCVLYIGWAYGYPPDVAFYIFFSTNISTEYFKHAAHSLFFLQNAVYFIMLPFFGSCIIHILHTGCAKV